MKEHYLDNSATTKTFKEAADKIYDMMLNCYGNPSSLHKKGFEAETELKAARAKVASSVGALESEIIFTSGGTESDNLAVIGGALSKKGIGRHVVSTVGEHPAVLSSLKFLESLDYKVTLVPLLKGGYPNLEYYENALSEDTVLISSMMVNNELGNIYPIKEMRKIADKKSPRALFHCDAVQGYGKIPIDVKALNVDMLTLSSHKVHGPKGVGALYIKNQTHIDPIIFGGGQEGSLRSGTENMASIAGFGVAASMIDAKIDGEKLSHLTEYLKSRLIKELGGVLINSPEVRAPHILNISLPPFRSETMLHFLEGENIYVSSGSACSSKKNDRTRVLINAGFSKKVADSALRISVGLFNDREDMDALVDSLKKIKETLIGA